jgi:hypothetical protein
VSSKSKTTQAGTQATTSQTSPTVPSWIADPTQNAAGQVAALQAGGPAAYTPGSSAVQQAATAGALNLQTSPYYGQASGVLNNVPQVTTGGNIDPVTGQSVLTNLQAYENPYQDQIINPVLQQYDQQSGMTQAAQAAAAARTNAFGGSRYGVESALTDQQLAMGRAQTQGGLLQGMYTQAAGMSAQDAANRQAAEMATQQGQEFMAGQTQTASQANQAAALQKAGLLTTLGSTQDTDARSNLQTQAAIGTEQTNLENQIKQYPLQYQAQIESLLSGLNPSMYTGSTTSGLGNSTSTSTTQQQPGLLQMLGAGISAGSMFAGTQGLGAMFGGGATSQAMPEFY